MAILSSWRICSIGFSSKKHQILNDEDKARIQKVYQLIDQSLLKELKECDFLKNIDVAELEKWSPNILIRQC